MLDGEVQEEATYSLSPNETFLYAIPERQHCDSNVNPPEIITIISTTTETHNNTPKINILRILPLPKPDHSENQNNGQIHQYTLLAKKSPVN